MKRNIFLSLFLFGFLSIANALDEKLSAVAVIKGTAADSFISGIADLSETDEGLLVKVSLENVAGPGPHGFHIHEVGDCGDMGKAAGGHFNPAQTPHGMVVKDGVEHSHAGDLGNIIVDEKGNASLEVVLPHVGLQHGHYNVAGLSVILHEKADDFGQPTGNAGGRIACGIIEIKK